MTVAAVKEKLHNYIDQANGKKAKALLELIENDFPAKEYEIDDETMNMLNERWELYTSGKMPVFTVQESMERIKAYRKSK